MDSKVVMSCRYCFFAKLNEAGEQEECSIGMLEKLANKGAVIYKDEDVTDSDKHFIIEERICNYKRDKTWGEGRENPLADARKELRVKYDAVIYYTPKNKFWDVVKTMKSLEQQSIPPRKVLVAMTDMTVRPFDFMKLNGETTLPWSMEIMAEPQALEDRGRAIDLCLKKCHSRFYLDVDAGVEVHKSYIKNVDSYLNDSLGRLLAVNPSDDHPYTLCTTALHKDIGGNKKGDAMTKITNEAKEQECQNMIADYQELLS